MIVLRTLETCESRAHVDQNFEFMWVVALPMVCHTWVHEYITFRLRQPGRCLAQSKEPVWRGFCWTNKAVWRNQVSPHTKSNNPIWYISPKYETVIIWNSSLTPRKSTSGNYFKRVHWVCDIWIFESSCVYQLMAVFTVMCSAISFLVKDTLIFVLGIWLWLEIYIYNIYISSHNHIPRKKITLLHNIYKSIHTYYMCILL